MHFPTIEDYVGHTPLVRLQRLPGETSNVILAKLEGNNPAGSVKDRPAISMIQEAERRGDIKPGDTLIEATSGNTGIALAMAAAIKGYRMVLIMPANMSEERRASMRAYGAEIVTVTKEEGMETARDLALKMQAEGKGRVLDQFSNQDNPLAHYRTTGPEIWEQTGGRVTHFVSSMGTTGTIMGVSRYLKERNPDIQIIGLQPKEGAAIPGIRRWPEAYLPKSMMPHGWTRFLILARKKPRTPCEPWLPRKASSVVSLPVVRSRRLSNSLSRLKTPSSWPLSVTAATAISPPVCSRRLNTTYQETRV